MEPIEYQETMATIRHYSNLRFALMTVFVTATAGLFALIFMTPAVSRGGFLTFLFKALALLLTALFWRLEVHLASYLFCLGQYIRKWEPSHYLILPDHGKQFISKLICAFYGALGAFWLIAMFL
ncbi:MAG: hypothetical protein ACQEW0_09480 [Pseudomonadota bacterium]